jgi:hypothetical protein
MVAEPQQPTVDPAELREVNIEGDRASQSSDAASRSPAPSLDGPDETTFKPGHRFYLAFGTLSILTLMVALDGTSISVALPVRLEDLPRVGYVLIFTDHFGEASRRCHPSLLGRNQLPALLHGLPAKFRFLLSHLRPQADGHHLHRSLPHRIPRRSLGQ